jgi:hypothetical protein
MSNEAGPDQPKDQDEIEMPDLSTPKQDFMLDIQDYVHNKPGPKARKSEKITIETEGKVVGRDKKPVPSKDVFKLAAIGMKDIEIAEWFGVDGNTLRYNFSVELLKGRNTLCQSLRRKQIEVAMSGNPTMLIFLGKNLLGQSDNPLASQEAQVLPWEDD